GTALGHAGYAGVEVVGQCEVVAGAHIDAVELTGGDPDVAGVVAGRFLAHQADGATEGATAEQGALRATQHFHALEIHQVHHRTHGGRVVDVVDVDAHAGLEGKVEVVLADAADEGRHGVAEGGLGRAERGVGDVVADVCGAGEGAGIDLVSGNCGDCQWRHLQAFLAVACGDHDFLNAGLLGQRGTAEHHG